MQRQDFVSATEHIADWIADYWHTLRDRPVRPSTVPGSVSAALPDLPPADTDTIRAVLDDFDRIVAPNLTHWQHPRFFAYFPANVSPASVLADMLIAATGVNAMLWETSPAATELEETMMDWLKTLMDLPPLWHGVIQDTASSATLAAVLMAREKVTDGRAATKGLAGLPPLSVYTTAEAHSSVEKAVRIAGLGSDGLRIVPHDDDFAMRADALAAMVADDHAAGRLPALVVATVGTTGVGACDPVADIADVAGTEGLLLHVDAAWAGTAALCPEFRAPFAGLDRADSYVFNPHKWMGVGFDCSAHFVADRALLTRTFSVNPAYLQTTDGVTNYRDWGVPLGRRMRALKLWFVLRLEGADRLRAMIRDHVAWADWLARLVAEAPDFDLVTGPVLSLLSFRFVPGGTDAATADRLTGALLDAVNRDGFTYLTRTLVAGRPVIRFQIGPMTTDWSDVEAAWTRVRTLAADLHPGVAAE